jgi:hypothetical protein
MFARFRQVGRRLKVSLAETRRAEGKVLQEHVASLGSVITPPDTADRIAFWQRLHDRLARLANRIDTETQGKILGQVHDRIPMPTVDEIRGLQLESAEADEQLWSKLAEMHESSAADHVGLRDKADKAIAEYHTEAENAKRGAAAAKDRIERLRKGEPVAGGLGRPIPLRDQLKAMGFSEGDLRHWEDMAELFRLVCGDDEAANEELLHEFSRDRVEAHIRSDRVYFRNMLKRLRRRLEILGRLDGPTRNAVLERLTAERQPEA